jgi:DNA-binding SARP family transcriptional activator
LCSPQVDSDRLIEALWGTQPPKTARAALQGYVTQLRRLLPPDRLATHAGGYVVSVELRSRKVHHWSGLMR